MRIPTKVTVPALVLFAAIVVFSFTRQGGNALGAQPVGQSAPDFNLPLYDGKKLSLSDLRGKPVVLNVWASWCDPCREEAPAIERVWQQYQDRGVVFVGIDIWDSEADGKGFIERFGLTYPNGPDAAGNIGKQYGVTGVPETFLIGKDGKVARKFIGAVSERQLAASVEEILR
jgi:cytochrome c biogenesis protein CcmG/thiol:disulfide interchange protein DsbE